MQLALRPWYDSMFAPARNSVLTVVSLKALAVVQSALILHAAGRGLGVKRANLRPEQIGLVQKVFNPLASVSRQY